MLWKYKNSWVELEGDDYVKAYPTICEQYIIAVYINDKKFPSPNYAVIYNLDGSIHRVLEMPKLFSVNSVKHLEQEKLDNSPLNLAKYQQGLEFNNFDWRKDEKGDLINSISIYFDRNFGEMREINPETGEIGRLIEDWENKDRFLY